ncbi:hypothetical protein GKQ38_03125 [Candidatus Nanohaloarchaea archaeon]|nr:hypothetical protein GKQ38_03125 [Candidatus Nanohaloarchaea archaeon]
MTGLYEYVAERLEEDGSTAVVATGKSLQTERNQWLYDAADSFEEQGVESEPYWLGVPGQESPEYDIESNVFEWDYSGELGTESAMLMVPKPGVLRYNPENTRNNPVENYKSIARKVDEGLDAALMTEVERDAGGELPEVEELALDISTETAGKVTPIRRETGGNAVLVERNRK